MVFSVFTPHLFAGSTVFPPKETRVKPYPQIYLKLYSEFKALFRFSAFPIP